MEPDSSSTKSPLSLISSTSSMASTVSSEGLLVVTSGPGSVASSPPEMVERKAAGTSSSYASSTDSECGSSSSRRDSSEEMESVDGLVLMGSTRLRPAPQASSSGLSKARLYVQTYLSMFSRLDCTSAILPLAMHGNLQNNPFRSVCWRVLLNVLPSSSVDWVTALQSIRTNYQFLNEKFQSAQKMTDLSLDPAINNPLSQEQESPWNQHFQDGEMRKMIKQDVVRTFPEVDFFQTPLVRETLVNILFVYARCHPEIGYRQGMHELLAPLYFVVKSDCTTYDDIVGGLDDNLGDEAKSVKEELTGTVHGDIFSAKFCEADTFALFEALMEAVGPWFISNKSVHTIAVGCTGKPWSRPQDLTTGNKLVDDLNHIQDELLKRHDPALFSRLAKLEIFPQIYGIRWLRLLFGREFVFRDTLLLWDAIFADSCPPSLCDQLVVSLLMSIRDLLLRYEYQDAVQLLMKLPSNLSVTYCTQLALHLKDPIRFPKPSGPAFAQGAVGGGKEKKKVVKTENRFRKISGPKIFKKDQPSVSKAPFELVKPVSRSTVDADNGADFTVLDMKIDKLDTLDVVDGKGVDSDPSVILSKPPPNKLKEMSNSVKYGAHAARDACLDSAQNNINDSGRRKVDIATVGEVKTELESVVASLDSLLEEETLIKRTEILENMKKMKSLLMKLPDVHKSARRTASVAVDVATYFEEE